MKKFKGTPGQWSINHWSNGKSGVMCVQLNKNGISYYTGDAVCNTHYGIRSKTKPLKHNNFGSFEGAHIADIDIPSTDEGCKEAEANARLIAAAPELLDTLQRILARLEYLDGNSVMNMDHSTWINMARMTIDKALGINE